VNLVGEHTDYNEGFALPFAIGAGCVAEVDRSPSGEFLATSAQQAASCSVTSRSVDRLPEAHVPDWVRYVLGPVWALRSRGVDVPPLRVAVDSDVPVGAGLSSSAAVVCSVSAALDYLLGTRLGPDGLLSVSRSVENDVVGAPTGGMDQLASLRCRAGHVLLCDMRDLTTEQIPMPLADHGLTVLVVDSRVGHAHSEGEYAQRRQGCATAAKQLGVGALREISLGELDQALAELDSDELRRFTRHVVTENDRVLRTVSLLRERRVREVGPLLTASHVSMRDDYRITTHELDVTAATLEKAGALGARLTGGGFGGCVIALVEEALVPEAVRAVRAAYDEHGFAAPGHFTVRPAEGATRL
jgi:galactokinase